jgi:D-serine dehydratase
VEGFEGMASGRSGPNSEEKEVKAFLADLLLLADALGSGEGPDAPLLSVGGSSYLDLVKEAFGRLRNGYRPLLRSGCYVTHDHGFYARKLDLARRRSGGGDLPRLQPALELWSYVQSLPDRNTAILNFGKRDCSYDIDLPRPVHALSPGQPWRNARPLGRAEITGLNDQHAFLSCPAGLGLRVGDKVACGISHPCTAFDKWRAIPVVDDSYEVVDLYRTFF